MPFFMRGTVQRKGRGKGRDDMAMLEGDWAQVLDDEFHKPYYKNLYLSIVIKTAFAQNIKTA